MDGIQKTIVIELKAVIRQVEAGVCGEGDDFDPDALKMLLDDVMLSA